MQSHNEVVVVDEAAQQVISRHECGSDEEARRIAKKEKGAYTAEIHLVYVDGHHEILDIL